MIGIHVILIREVDGIPPGVHGMLVAPCHFVPFQNLKIWVDVTEEDYEFACEENVPADN